MNSAQPDDIRFLELINENRGKILKIWRALPGLKEDAYAGAWLYRVALNTSISFIRKNAGRNSRANPCRPNDLARRIESAQEPDESDDGRLSRLSALLVMVYPIWRKRHLAKAAPDASLMQSLESELRKVEVEIALLRSVHWWYLLPGAVGVVVFIAGLNRSITWTILFALFVIALDVFIYWLNQIACDKKLLPLKRDLESLLRFDGTVHPSEIPKKYIMAKMIMLGFVLLFVGTIGYLPIGYLPKHAKIPASGPYIDPTSQMLEAIRVKHKFPALAATVLVDGKIVATNAVGFRKDDGTE